jgi:hypothetical protein
MNDLKRHAPATLRNREPILAVLERVLPPEGLILELNSGSGEHAAFMAPRLAPRRWQPSDIDAAARASIAAHAKETGAGNLLPPLEVDVSTENWPINHAAALISINMIHIAPWDACLGLLNGAERLLAPDRGVFYLYGPFKRDGVHTAPSNEAFDRSLRMQDSRWGVRDLEDVISEAESRSLKLSEIVEMPSNNLSVIFRKVPVAA